MPAALEARPDVALLDIEMPGSAAWTPPPTCATRLPGCRVADAHDVRAAGLPAPGDGGGRAGFLVKDGPVEELAAAIRRVLAGEKVIDPELAAAALSTGANPLTDRERDVLAAAADGATIADIAARLHLSESTVRNYLSAAIGKTGTRNRIEAARTARHNGWL